MAACCTLLRVREHQYVLLHLFRCVFVQLSASCTQCPAGLYLHSQILSVLVVNKSTCTYAVNAAAV